MLAVTVARLAALDVNTRRVIAAVALLTAPTVTSVVAVVGDRAVDGLAEAAREGLLQINASAVLFAHPLLRSAAAATLSDGERRTLHRTLASVVSDPDERVAHEAAAAAGPDEAVAHALDAAADRAFARGAPDAAAALAARAAALTPPDAFDTRARRRIRTAEYHYRLEDVEAARLGLVELVAQLPAGELRAEALLVLATVRQAQNAIHDAVDLARQSLAEARGDLLRAAAARFLALALVITGDVAGGDRYATIAIAAARASGDARSVAESDAALAWTRFWLGHGLQSDLLVCARTYTVWSRYAPHDSSPAVVVGLLTSWADRLAEARDVLLAEDRRLVELGRDRPRAVVLFTLTELECRAGNWTTARRHAADGLLAAADDEFYRCLLHSARGLVAAHRGELESARADAAEALAGAHFLGSVVGAGYATALLGFIELSAGDPEAAHRHLASLTATVPRDGAFDPGLVRFVPDEVEALVALGDAAAAEDLLTVFELQARRLDRPWALATSARCRALLLANAGDADGARRALDAALNQHQRIEMPFERARTLLLAGSIHRRARRVRDARLCLNEATTEFTRLGAGLWTDRARGEAARLGGRVPSPRAMTDTEQRIAALAATGRTNKEIAAALFITVSTAEGALWKIYRKLDVRSRTELANRIIPPPP